eukprot:TRINITY_DN2766_c0_g1_i1.p1 TRINITY_DN2766_c0_g1~~TRINITY_DN2766_c0_g1_i1.p1  ORF type:complete len:196 (+),score=52.90 TRINITY_DN2766_c0_g1_i1:89-676(+)
MACVASVVIGSLIVLAQGQLDMVCAPPGEAFCANASDMAIINTPKFANDLAKAGPKAYSKDTTGAQAIEQIIGAGKLSAGCLACQAIALDCGVAAGDCARSCSESSCSVDCKICIKKACDVQQACGGVPGKTIQAAFACADKEKPDDMEVSDVVNNTKFEGTCGKDTQLSGAIRMEGTVRTLLATALAAALALAH